MMNYFMLFVDTIYNKQNILWMFCHLADYAQIEYNQGPKEGCEFIKYMAEAFFL